MVKPVDMDDSRRGPDSELDARHRRNQYVWVWAVLAIVLILVLGGLMSLAAKGLGTNTGRIVQNPGDIEDVAKDAAKGGPRSEPPQTPAAPPQQ